MIGAMSGMVSSTFVYFILIINNKINLKTYPLDLVRTLLTLQVKSQQYKGIFSTLSHIYKTEGLPGLYRGWTMSLIVSKKKNYFMCLPLGNYTLHFNKNDKL